MNPISIKNISKSYGPVQALKQVSLEVFPREIFGLIGPDGAGKTSLIRILASLILPSSGEVKVLGYDTLKNYADIRRQIGYMPGRFSLYQDLSVEENLQLFAKIFNTTIQENYHLISPIYVQLEPFNKRRAGKLSGGMKQKLALCCALIHKPEVLLLDEPTTGVDPVSRKEFWEMLKNLKDQGLTILVSTPYMDEAMLCDRIGLIQEGKILSTESPEAIIASYPKELVAIKGDIKYRILQDLQNYSSTATAYLFGEEIHFSDAHIEISEVEKWLTDKGHQNFIISITRPGVEDCFIALMQEEENGG